MLKKIQKICILGATGLLGQALVREGKKRNLSVIGVARKNADVNLDITKDSDLKNFIENNNFDCVINTCAYVNHDVCEKSPGEAYLLNSRPSAILAGLSLEYDFKYVYISTDGYFNGDSKNVHNEEATVQFFNEYARTKYAGECFALTNANSLVVRTNIVGFKGAETPTFAEWVIENLSKQNMITLFDDYYTSSISVSQFSNALYDLISKDVCGRINLASSEVSSKKEFITKLAEVFNFSLSNTTIGSIKNLLGSRRADSLGLDITKAEKLLGYKLPNLMEVIEELHDEYKQLGNKN